jgi:hypothetical protein
MKLVVCFSTGSETWNADHVLPIEYESAEQLLVDYETEVRRAAAAKADRFGPYTFEDFDVHFFGTEWDLSDLYDPDTKTIYDIEIHTVEEWFDQYKVNCK